ncbi:MAG: type I-A CRISPR-associated protein Cas5a [Nitrososphaerota archaeon]
MIGFLFDVEFVWGFQCKVAGLSKSPPSFYYPPPTTMLGALAEQIAKNYGIGEKRGREVISKLSSKLLAIGIKPINCIPVRFSDINRSIAVKLTGGKKYPRPDDLAGSFDAPAIGKTLLSSLDLEAPCLRIFVVFNDKVIYVDKEEIELGSDIIWGIHRIGSKESIVSILYVREVQPTTIFKDVDTMYSFPLIDGVKPKEKLYEAWIKETFINPFELESYNEADNPVTNYLQGKKLLQYMEPMKLTRSDPSYRVELDKNKCGYKFNDEVVIGKCP